MKYYSIRTNGTLPSLVQQLVDKMDGEEIDLEMLDNEIHFIVVECKTGHGNTRPDGSGWIYSKENGGNLWNVDFDVYEPRAQRDADSEAEAKYFRNNTFNGANLD